MVFGDYFRRRIAPLQERSRGAWEYTRYNDPMRTHVGVGPVGAAPVAAPSARVAAARPQAAAEPATPAGTATSGHLVRAVGPGEIRPGDPKGKRKMFESRPPSPPRGGGAERVADRPPAGHKRPAASEAGRKKKRLRKIGQTEPCRGSFIEPPKWTFKRPPSQGSKSERPDREGPGRPSATGPSQYPGGAHRTHAGFGSESATAEVHPFAGDGSGGGVPPRADPEGATYEERHSGAEAEAIAARRPRWNALRGPRQGVTRRPRPGAGPNPRSRSRPSLPEGPRRG
ncbi:hypothetical protein OsJ_13637 [Oryza sativa Japonica Group]|uniref:Uncharacterized protein n=1 Tax=Oryza sativa subsp. japonica TaxID=39947 RepID=B9FDG4_ORYSJ|nr:hypothetical protein OsJ_13637 [Oryza sativa Japonica Group]